MYAELVPFLRCPRCQHATLELLGPLHDGDEIVSGALRCPECATQTPILHGVWDALGDEPVSRSPAQLTNYLPLTALVYEPAWRWMALSLMSGRHLPLREELTLLRELIAPAPGKLYLDVACSAGLYARALSGPGIVVAGFDHSMPFCVQARRLARAAGLRVSYVRAIAQALPVADDAAAGVVMGGSLNEIGDAPGALREIGRSLASDGRFFCMNLVAARSAWGRLLQGGLGTGGIDFPTVDELNQQFAASGLRPRAQWVERVVAMTLLDQVADPL